ncbi:MAG: ABC transporter ATP-binding protein [Opitutaceae bacterium]|jgi:lipopolysaccharide transport system ATP-binding protein
MGSIHVNHLGKAYKQYFTRWSRLAEWLLPFFGVRHHTHWVLQDINFTVQPGEAVGIVGVNGAGKSTLLKMITGTAQPTTGSVHTNGRVAALLELGMGFHPDFTGRQNVIMAGQLLGMSIEEIDRLMPEIDAFAEIGDYMNQPVRVYSSGMQVRLAFSLATAVRPAILIVDEALSVGDVYFQHKCMLRIRSFKEAGTTLLFVSHSPDSIRMLCNRAILIANGCIKMDADAASVMDYYRASQVQRCELPAQGETTSSLVENAANQHEGRESKVLLTRESVGEVSVEMLGFSDSLHTGDVLTIKITACFNEDYADPHIGFGIRSKMGIVIYEANSYTLNYATMPVKAGEKLTASFAFPCRLFPGTYELMIGVANGGYNRASFEQTLFFDQSYLLFEVLAGEKLGSWAGLWDVQPEITVKLN